jgi:hypothetical protein
LTRRSYTHQCAKRGPRTTFCSQVLALAAIGPYGVTAYGVARPTNEIGLRMALGADRRNVIAMVLSGALRRPCGPVYVL